MAVPLPAKRIGLQKSTNGGTKGLDIEPIACPAPRLTIIKHGVDYV